MNCAPHTAIVVFARAPQAETKHLGLGTFASMQWHSGLIKRTLQMARRTHATVIYVSDAKDADLKQRGASFEDRFLNALNDVAALGYQRMIVVGSDTPGLGESELRRALASNEITIGPSVDGGFYLLAIHAHQIGLLKGLPWQRSDLVRLLLERLSNEVVVTLSALSDVDDWHDLITARRDHRDLHAIGVSWPVSCHEHPPKDIHPCQIAPPSPSVPRGPPCVV